MKSLGIVVLSCAFLLLAPPGAPSADDGFVVRTMVSPGSGLRELQRAVLGARRRLGQLECQRLFSEFSDTSGRPLQQKLDALGQTGTGYLGWVVFADGSGRAVCKAGGSLAFTTPGSRVVYVCVAQLKRGNDENATMVEAVIIHEMLHSLGLGENPPSPTEITARVLARCHR
jgi:hypothetical protein